MKAAKVVSVLLGMLIVMPIWYYLLYQVLVRVHATELMLFLFWVYVPVGVFVKIIESVVDRELSL